MPAILRISITIFIFLSGLGVRSQTPVNLNLKATISFAPQTLAGCWHYESGGKSYALLGASGGLIVVDVSIPDSPQFILQVPGVASLWREVKTLGNYAYVVTEGLDTNGVYEGLQVVNLSFLPDSAPSFFYKGDGLIENELITAHSITSDENYLYLNGHNIQSLGRGVLILDVSDPVDPVYVGAITNNYCHDSYVRGDTIWTSDIYAGQFSVYNISDRTNPVLLATQQTPGNFNHNTWLSDDGQTLFTTDERGNEPLGSYDVSDLNNISLLDTYFTLNFPASEVHNVRVLNDFLVNPSYGSQLTIVDAARPHNLVEVGSYMTGSYLLWDADPYLSSGIIVATETNPGVFYVFEPVYQRACYLEGVVTDSLTGIPLPSARIEILGQGITKNSNGNGEYATGILDPGAYDIQFTRQGYAAKVINNVNLSSGMVSNLNVEMRPLGIGIDEMKMNESIYAGPNPFTEKIEIETRGELLRELSLFNILGEQILIHQPAIPFSKYTVDAGNVAKGTYLLKIQSGKEAYFRKMIRLD